MSERERIKWLHMNLQVFKVIKDIHFNSFKVVDNSK